MCVTVCVLVCVCICVCGGEVCGCVCVACLTLSDSSDILSSRVKSMFQKSLVGWYIMMKHDGYYIMVKKFGVYATVRHLCRCAVCVCFLVYACLKM